MIYTYDTTCSARCRHPYLQMRTPVGPFMVAVRHQGLPVSLVSPPPSLLQMTFPNVQPPPCSDETRMLRMLKAMYVLLGQTLDGATNSLSAVERMSAACSLVSKTVATFKGWRASAAVVALLQPAKDVTDSFSRRSMRNGWVVGERSMVDRVDCSAAHS